MSERRPPYTTRTLPRRPCWPGETSAPNFTPPLGGAAELDRLRQRIAALEAAARAVCGPHECVGLLFRAIEELGRIVGEEGGGQ